MTFLALIAIIFFGFAVYNLTCAFVDIPTKRCPTIPQRTESIAGLQEFCVYPRQCA